MLGAGPHDHEPSARADVAEALVPSEQDPALATLNELARELLGVPISIVSLVTGRRQVSIAQAGLTDNRTVKLELPFSHTLCQHVVASGDALVIDDARHHPLADARSMREMGVMAYAGVPLTLADGQTVGAFCAVDVQAHAWTGAELRTISMLRDVAAELLQARRLASRSVLHDPVTDLPREALFLERVSALGAVARRDERVVVAALDLDGFGELNARLGRPGGDAVLSTVGRLLTDRVRHARHPGVVARLGADTFLAARLTARSEGVDVTRLDLTRAVAAHFPAGTATGAVVARASSTELGPQGRPEAAVELVLAGVRRDRPADPIGDRRLQIREALAGALGADELSLDYQPIFDLASGHPHRVEALLRWQNDRLGPVAPGEFIDEAERTGLIVPIGEWVLAKAMADLRRWRHARPGSGLAVSVNLSPEQLLVPGFVERVSAMLDEHRLPPRALVIEITERMLAPGSEAAAATLDALGALGVQLSIDDFGSGFSTLGRLSSFPIDEVKLDRSFILGLTTSPRQATLVKSIVAMAGGLGARVVAEGIEELDQLDALRALGCSHGQGYLLSRPVPAGQVELDALALGS